MGYCCGNCCANPVVGWKAPGWRAICLSVRQGRWDERGDQMDGMDVPLGRVLRNVGCLALWRHRVWVSLIRTAGAIGLGWILLILWWILLRLIWVPVGRVSGVEVGCVDIREAGVCGGGIFYERVVGQTGAIMISVHGRGQLEDDEMIIMAAASRYTGLCNSVVLVYVYFRREYETNAIVTSAHNHRTLQSK